MAIAFLSGVLIGAGVAAAVMAYGWLCWKLVGWVLGDE